MCACLDVKMDPQLSAGEPLGGVAEKNLVKKARIVTLVAPVQADDMLAGSVGGESEFAFTAVNLEQKHYSCFSSDEQQFTFERMLFLLTRIHLWEDDLVIRISDFHVHPNLRAGMYSKMCKCGLLISRIF